MGWPCESCIEHVRDMFREEWSEKGLEMRKGEGEGKRDAER